MIMVKQEPEQLLQEQQPSYDNDDDDGSSFDLGLEISADDLAGGASGMRLARRLGLAADEDEPSTIAEEVEEEEEESEILEVDRHDDDDDEEEEKESAAGDDGDGEALDIADDFEDDVDDDDADDALINENDVLLDAMWQSAMSMAWTITVQSIVRPLIRPVLAMGGLGMFFYSNVWRPPRSSLSSSSSFPSLWMIMTASTTDTATPWTALLLFGSTSFLAMAGMRTLATTSSTSASSSSTANNDHTKWQPRRRLPQFADDDDDDEEEDNNDDARRKQI